MLLEAGSNKDLQGNDGYTALIFSCENGHVEVARMLLEAAADMNMTTHADGDSCTALLCAHKEGDMEVARLLLQASADMNLTRRLLLCRDFP